MNEMKFESVEVAHVTDWFPVSKIPTEKNPLYDEMNDRYGLHGIYQVAFKDDIDSIGDNFVHEKIGYTGKSEKSILNRTYSIRTPSGGHGVSRYIRQNNIDRSKVYIRYVYCSEADVTSLENKIHSKTKDLFGYTFEWLEASAGSNGRTHLILDEGKRLTSEELLYIISEYKKYAIEANAKEFLEKLEEI
jgi:hypothetical protein